jgi:hypothetical protein
MRFHHLLKHALYVFFALLAIHLILVGDALDQIAYAAAILQFPPHRHPYFIQSVIHPVFYVKDDVFWS